MSLEPELRRAVANDLGELMALERASVTAPHWSLKVWKELLEKRVEDIWAQPRVVFVAVNDGKPAGFVVGQCVGFVAELESIVVSDAMQRSGLGQALLAELSRWAAAQGAAAMELEVRASNAPAVAFYQSRGFVEQGRRKNYYLDPVEDAVLMSLELPLEL